MVPSLVNPPCDSAESIPTTEARTDTGGDGARLNGGDGGGVADGGGADGGVRSRCRSGSRALPPVWRG